MSIRRETRKSLRKLPSYAQAVELQLIEKNGGCSFIQCEYSRGYGFRGGMELISVGTRRSHQSNRETLRPMKHITCPLCWKMLSFAERSQLQTEISFECLLILSTRCVDRTIFNCFLHFMIVLDDENSTSVSRPRDVFLSIWYIRVLKKSSRISLLSIELQSWLRLISARADVYFHVML
jgi:hypothetical protein